MNLDNLEINDEEDIPVNKKKKSVNLNELSSNKKEKTFEGLQTFRPLHEYVKNWNFLDSLVSRHPIDD